VAPPLQPGVVEPYPVWGMVPEPFVTRGNGSYPKFWAITGSLWYPGYFTLIVAYEPSVNMAVKNIFSTGGRIGAHTLLRALPQDSMVRLWG
jgi:hypothetical protein